MKIVNLIKSENDSSTLQPEPRFRLMRLSRTIKDKFEECILGLAKTQPGFRTVPFFGYIKPFPKTGVPITKGLELHGVTIHSLRKSYAYFLKSNNVDVTTAAKFMGHSNPLVTLKIYTMVLYDEIYTIGDELRRTLKGV